MTKYAVSILSFLFPLSLVSQHCFSDIGRIKAGMSILVGRDVKTTDGAVYSIRSGNAASASLTADDVFVLDADDGLSHAVLVDSDAIYDMSTLGLFADYNSGTMSGTNQSITIQQILDAGGDGKNYIIPPGDYFISTAITVSESSIMITFAQGARVYSSINGDIFTVTGNNVIVDNLTIEKNDATPVTGEVFMVSGDDVSLKNMNVNYYNVVSTFRTGVGDKVENLLLSNVYGQNGGGNGFTMIHAYNFRFIDCSFVNYSGDGGKLNVASEVGYFDGGLYSSNGDDNIDCYGGGRNVQFHNLIFLDGQLEVKTGSEDWVDNVLIKKCYFYGNAHISTDNGNHDPFINLAVAFTTTGGTTYAINHNLGYDFSFFDDNVSGSPTTRVYEAGSTTEIGHSITGIDDDNFNVVLDAASSGQNLYIVINYDELGQANSNNRVFVAVPSGSTFFTATEDDWLSPFYQLELLSAADFSKQTVGYTIGPDATADEYDVVRVDFTVPTAQDMIAVIQTKHDGFKITIEDCYFENRAWNAVSVTNFVIRNCTFNVISDNADPLSISAAFGTCIIENCQFNFNPNISWTNVDAAIIEGSWSPFFGPMPDNSTLIVRGNTQIGGPRFLIRNYNGIGPGPQYIVTDNRIYDIEDGVGNAGISFIDGERTSGVKEIRRNNKIYQNGNETYSPGFGIEAGVTDGSGQIQINLGSTIVGEVEVYSASYNPIYTVGSYNTSGSNIVVNIVDRSTGSPAPISVNMSLNWRMKGV